MCVWEERVVEVGNSICVISAISDSVSLHLGVLTIHWIRTKSVHRTPS